jgi:propanol-preferring alcohol dehydrogenase
MMRAAVIHDFGRPLVVEDVPVPEPADDHVLVRVRAAGICATDLKLAAGTTAPPPPLPHIPGHEVAGEVARATDDLTVGQRVACHILHACGACAACRRGYPVFCPSASRLGLDRNGGMAEYVAIPRSTVLALPDSVSYEHAAVTMDSVLTPWTALHQTGRLQAGETVVVAGVGGLGINAVQLAVAVGARVAAVDVDEDRLAAARAAGAELAVRPAEADRLRAWSGDGADMAVELSGRREGFDVAAAAVHPGGRVICCGYAPGVEYGMDSARLVLDNIRILGSRNATPAGARAALDAVASGAVIPRIADVMPLDQINVALERLAAGHAAGRLVVVPEPA